MPPRCAACPADMCADHSLRLAQKVIAQDFFLRLFRQNRKRGSKGGVAEQDGLTADGKGVFLVRLRRGKLDKLLIRQIVKGNFPFPPPAQFQDYIYGGVTNDNLAKGVKSVLDMHFVGFIFGYGNSPSLNNSAGRQHSLLSPLDCLPAKAGGAAGGAMRRLS